MTQVIAFIGGKGSGKDTAFKAIEAPGIVNIKFAEPLKEMLRTYLRFRMVDRDVVERMLEGDLKELPCIALDGKSPRHAMQTLGTEWGRDLINSNIWINTARDRIAYHVNQGRRVVITDCRFENEMDMLKDVFNTYVFKVERNDYSAAVDHHLSESGIHTLPFDKQLSNDDSEEVFVNLVQSTVFQTVWKS